MVFGAAGALGLALVSSAAIAGCKIWFLDTREGQPEVPEAGQLAPEFDLPDQDGNRVTLDGLLAAGAPAVLVFYRGHW